MNIVKLTQVGRNLYFTGVDKKGNIKIGFLPLSELGKQKVDWGFEVSVNK